MAYPSTFVDLQNKVMRRVRLDATNDLTRVKDWINQAYSDVCIKTEALQKRATMTLTANASIYTLPTAVSRIKYVACKRSGNTEYDAPLEQLTVDQLLDRRRSAGGVSADRSTPTHYALVGLNQFELWPAPAAADTLLMYYVYQPTALSADADVPVLQEPWNSKLLFYGALVEASDDIDVPKADRYIQLYDRWLGDFNTHLIKREGFRVRQMELIGAQPFRPHDPSTDLGY